MVQVLEEALNVDAILDEPCAFCLDWHSESVDGPYPAALCTFDA